MKNEDIEIGIEALKNDIADLLYNNVMKLCSNAIRGCIVAPPGKKLVVSDLSNIEGRVQAWLAGEEWKLAAFRAFDGKTGHDLYALAYAKAFGVSPEAVMLNKKDGGNWRQIGKVMELALGYEGGVGAFVTFALVYGIDLEDMARNAIGSLPQGIAQSAAKNWERALRERRTLGLEREVFIVCDAFKQMWRLAHPNIKKMWRELQDAIAQAIGQPNYNIQVGPLTVRRDKNWLRIILPSGRSLCYPSPRIVDGVITYMGMHQYTKKWTRIKSYGGKFFENVCQAVARDVMAFNMQEIEDEGYEIVLSVHDELLTEADDEDRYTARILSTLLAKNKKWNKGLPLAAGGFEAYHYKKEA